MTVAVEERDQGWECEDLEKGSGRGIQKTVRVEMVAVREDS